MKEGLLPSRKLSPMRFDPLEKKTPLIVLGVFLLTLLSFTAGYLTHGFIRSEKPVSPLAKYDAPPFEIFPEDVLPPPKKQPLPPPEPGLPKVAIIIDDIGYDLDIAKKFLELDIPITLSILPFSPYKDEILEMAREKNQTIMLHMPMEPIEYPHIKPGPGTLLTSMPPGELKEQIRRNLEDIPGIVGVNNHMGSRFTSVFSPMYLILSALKEEGLFFIDSITTHDTKGWTTARLLQVPFAQRDIFLDHVQREDVVSVQIQKLIKIARTNGEAIGIGHPHRVTYNALLKALPGIKKNTRPVFANHVVHITG